ncbi:hypothetical protein SAMN04488503_0145 [Humidesulfovibrio mexicanus]|uniref:Uncharacterized protein n=1 Tax=Humidesulfovibrio mexicanus TaxID=147047 RepID=A0A239D8P0_9BACT|nr:hypothetical protein [Humidesulfovibrio mexicanus]SNS28211.1 hypothetical protein SAMN04488503_0145 [Humidesulfovibrio mexicanus]
MGLHIRFGVVAVAGTALLGLAAYAALRSEKLRPVLVGAVRGGVKAADWLGEKASTMKQGVCDMVAEARADIETPKAAKPAAKSSAKPAAKSSAKPAAKSVAKASAKPAAAEA